MITPEGITIEAGQVWKDNDPRSAGRTFEVIGVDENVNGYAAVLVKGLTTSRNVSRGVGAVRKIRLHRFRNNNRGYSLVEG